MIPPGGLSKLWPAWVAAGLCLASLLVWWPVLQNNFINYDDGGYLTQNTVVQQGLSKTSLRWAFTTTAGGNWHPVTWLSHALDCQLFGLNPRWHHLTSLALHLANTVLLFFLFQRLTGSLWRSAFVAALFALHPLRVESVAWAAERKDVLSGCFFFLTLLAWERAVQSAKLETQTDLRITNRFWYTLALVFFVLGLMSKPMLVTLPLVLLLLDYWPLGRLRLAAKNLELKTISRLLWEKLPFIGLAAVMSVVTYRVQAAGSNTLSLPFQFRLQNAFVSCAGYVLSFVWPHPLAVLYPRPAGWPLAWVLGSVLFLAAVTGLVVWRARSQRYLVTGWFWFLGMLVPVSGLIAIGEHWRADRYTYLPAIGLALIVVWGAGEMVARRPYARRLALAVAGVALTCCGLATRSYVREWQNSATLFEHTLRVTGTNPVASLQLAGYFRSQGLHAQAGTCCAQALLWAPGSAPAWNLMALLLADEGHLDKALVCASNSIAAKPDWNADAYFTRGSLQLELGRRAQAMADFQRALRLNPEHIRARLDLATLLAQDGQLDQAIAHYEFALRLAPALAAGHYDLANALMKTGRVPNAIEHYERALQLNPTNAAAHCNLAQAVLQQQFTNQARAHFESALQLDPGLAQAHYGLGTLLYQNGQAQSAVLHLRQALLPNADFPAALEELAWILATEAQPEIRDCPSAVNLAERALRLSSRPEPRLFLIMATAYGCVGRLEEAIRAAEQARALAQSSGQLEWVGRANRCLDDLRTGRRASW